MGPIRICTMSEKKFAFLLFASLLLPAFSFSEPVAFKRAVELAIRNSTAINAATADTSRLQATYQEARDQYIPQVYFGEAFVGEEDIILEIELETAPVEVGRPDQADLAVDHHRLRMEQPAAIFEPPI